ncbi:52 kDa repressor of the inhibitor of the protein kinase-like [Tubulanus polymorphus]|uniref:52 kDa repressor of the inhibitor of the protein kinase-like n=1 Tax=Tubulanus polymorphus TaxID=672921 RepID=UPI003DA3682B
MADEVSSHNREELSLCVRFVDSSCSVREEFLGFLPLLRTAGLYIAQTILRFLDEIGLDFNNLRGQAYDGAVAMSSDLHGVQAQIKQQAPNADYVHCNNHCLNLVIVHSSKIAGVRNMIDKLQAVFLFFNNSPKRHELLKNVISVDCEHAYSNRLPLLSLCKTRWTERHSSYRHFYQAFTYIVTSLEIIGLNLHKKEGYSNDLVPESVTVLLQSRAVDIVAAYNMMTEIRATYAEIRNKLDDQFAQTMQQSIRMAKAVSSEAKLPRVAGRQQHRANAPAGTPEEYYRRNLAIPFVDHICCELDSQFSRNTEIAISALQIVLEALKCCEKALYPNIHQLLRILCTIPVSSCGCERSFSVIRRLSNYMRANMGHDRLSALALIHIS